MAELEEFELEEWLDDREVPANGTDGSESSWTGVEGWQSDSAAEGPDAPAADTEPPPEGQRAGTDQPAARDVDNGIATAHGAVTVAERTSAEVDDALERIDRATRDQVDEMETVAERVSGLSATIEEIAASAEEVNALSDTAEDRAREGSAAAAEVVEDMERIRSIGAAVRDDVGDLEAVLDDAEEVLSSIDRLAEQTNLLALNASIEAARVSGDDGGFEVIAEEIQSLSDESRERAAEVDALLEDIRETTTATADALERATDEMDDGAERVTEVMADFDTILDAVEGTADGVDEIATATDSQASASEEITARCEETADGARTVASALEAIRELRSEQTTMLDEIDAALAGVRRGRHAGTDDRPSIPTGDGALDAFLGGGLYRGGQVVVEHDGDEAVVDRLLVSLVASALSADHAVSLSPTATLAPDDLEAGLAAHGHSLRDSIAADDLFVLDLFDAWGGVDGVYDPGASSLSAVNERSVELADGPMLVVGNVHGETAELGEAAAREARFENDSVFADTDTVVNVVDRSAVEDTIASFYAGAAHQTLQFDGGPEPTVQYTSIFPGESGGDRRVATRADPPRVTLR